MNLYLFSGTCLLKFSDIRFSISTVICPAGCWLQKHELCGTGMYGDGPVCLAAIHAGIVSSKRMTSFSYFVHLKIKLCILVTQNRLSQLSVNRKIGMTSTKYDHLVYNN